MLALSFPRFGHPAIAWIALAPVLIALTRGSLPRAFTLGLTTGLVYFAGTIYWASRVMAVYGGLETAVAVFVNAALVAYLALYPALFAVVMRRLLARFGPQALTAAPLVWVATELGRTHLFTGFPWVLLGYSQAGVLPIAQLASVFGVYGVSALVASVSAAVAMLAAGVSINPAQAGSHTSVGSGRAFVGSGFGRTIPLVVTLALVGGIAGWGALRLNASELTRMGEPVRVGLVQGNVDQAEKWDPARSGTIFADYLAKTEQAIAGGAQVVIWPEASTPFSLEEDPAGAEAVRAIARTAGVPILVGSNQVQHGEQTKYYNAAFLIGADGRTGGVYRKIHLVPFGEYVPLKKLFFFAAPLVEAVSDFSPGDTGVLLPVNGHRVSTAICYEIVYPNLVHGFVVSGSELLTTITNDAWFGRTSAPYQHFAQASMRAIESGRYLARAANTGISGLVDPYGRIVAQSRIFEPTVIVEQARFLTTTTLYTRFGDIFAYASAIITVALLVLARGPRRKMVANGKRQIANGKSQI